MLHLLIMKVEHSSLIQKQKIDNVYYLQSQNGNLYTPSTTSDSDSNADAEPSECEFLNIRKDVPKDISWASQALGHLPDAVNIWIGDEKSITSVHSGKSTHFSLFLFLRVLC